MSDGPDHICGPTHHTLHEITSTLLSPELQQAHRFTFQETFSTSPIQEATSLVEQLPSLDHENAHLTTSAQPDDSHQC